MLCPLEMTRARFDVQLENIRHEYLVRLRGWHRVMLSMRI
jgi:hypothetical protein